MKNLIIGLIKAGLKCCCILPVKTNRVLFSAYSGKSYSCNPKYICEKLLEKCGDNVEIIWAFNDPGKFSFNDRRIKTVKFKSPAYIYYALTSHVFVDNVESWSVLPSRKDQLVINTWHGGGAYKGVGLKRKDTNGETDKNMLAKHSRVGLYLSSSKAFSEMTLRNSFGYKGYIMECGMPRNDILINPPSGLALKVKARLGVPQDTKLCIFAPTFRADTGYEAKLDYEAVLASLEKRFGGEWKMLYRAHYYVGNSAGASRITDVSDYPDMQELLLASDVLITDYSSSMWDFSLTGKPAFLYMPDLEEYSGSEREFYTPVSQWPYSYATTPDGLAEIIENYDAAASEEKIKKHHEALGITESGEAASAVADMIEDYIK